MMNRNRTVSRAKQRVGCAVKVLMLAAFMALCMFGIYKDVHAAPAGFTFCAGEDAMCTVSAPAWVTVGAGEGTCAVGSGLCTGAYSVLLEVDTSVVCSVTGALSSLAGYPLQDPAPGQVKSCFYQLKGDAPDPGASAPSGVGTALILPAWLDLSAADGLMLAGAIIGVWAAAYFWRAAMDALSVADDNGSSD